MKATGEMNPSNPSANSYEHTTTTRQQLAVARIASGVASEASRV